MSGVSDLMETDEFQDQTSDSIESLSDLATDASEIDDPGKSNPIESVREVSEHDDVSAETKDAGFEDQNTESIEKLDEIDSSIKEIDIRDADDNVIQSESHETEVPDTLEDQTTMPVESLDDITADTTEIHQEEMQGDDTPAELLQDHENAGKQNDAETEGANANRDEVGFEDQQKETFGDLQSTEQQVETEEVGAEKHFETAEYPSEAEKSNPEVLDENGNFESESLRETKMN